MPYVTISRSAVLTHLGALTPLVGLRVTGDGTRVSPEAWVGLFESTGIAGAPAQDHGDTAG